MSKTQKFVVTINDTDEPTAYSVEANDRDEAINIVCEILAEEAEAMADEMEDEELRQDADYFKSFARVFDLFPIEEV